MTNIGDGFKNIFLAGIGALAYTGEKGKEIIDQLVEKGELTLDQGKELNDELRRKADDATKNVRESALEAAMKAMSPSEREAFVAKAAEIAQAQNAAAEQPSDGFEVEIESVEDLVDEAAEAVEEAVEAVEEAVEEVEARAADQA